MRSNLHPCRRRGLHRKDVEHGNKLLVDGFVVLDGAGDGHVDDQLQAELIPINLDLRHFNLQMGVRYDYMHYRNTLEAKHILDVNRLDNYEKIKISVDHIRQMTGV